MEICFPGRIKQESGLKKMAEGRMLKKRVSKSTKFASLKSDKSRLLYLLLIPHLDVEGRFEANLSIVKGNICPYVSSLSERSIGHCLKDLHDSGLICVYEVDGEKFLQLMRFHDFNNVNPSKEAESHIPPPTPEQLQSNSRATPPKVEVKGSISKDKDMSIFDSARKLFKGTKRGNSTEFENYRKKHNDWKECLELLEPAIHREIIHRDNLNSSNAFCPEWANFQTWINQRRWEQEFPHVETPKSGSSVSTYDPENTPDAKRLREEAKRRLGC